MLGCSEEITTGLTMLGVRISTCDCGPGTTCTGTLTLGLPASRTIQNIHLLLVQFMVFSLQLHKWAKALGVVEV